MGKTAIEWTDYTFNPWWGCTKVSPACKLCYAEATDKRYHGGAHWGDQAPRRFFGEKYWQQPLKWNRQAAQEGVRKRVFCGSMCDIFEEHPDVATNLRMAEERALLGEIAEQTPWLEWLFLTKRPDNWRKAVQHEDMELDTQRSNIRIGVTIEHKDQIKPRLDGLDEWFGRRFVSFEPLLGPVGDLSFWLPGEIGWAIVGAESGRKQDARPMDLDWARSIRDQCQRADIPFFMKQICVDGKKIPYSDFPADLQIREFPQ